QRLSFLGRGADGRADAKSSPPAVKVRRMYRWHRGKSTRGPDFRRGAAAAAQQMGSNCHQHTPSAAFFSETTYIHPRGLGYGLGWGSTEEWWCAISQPPSS